MAGSQGIDSRRPFEGAIEPPSNGAGAGLAKGSLRVVILELDIYAAKILQEARNGLYFIILNLPIAV